MRRQLVALGVLIALWSTEVAGAAPQAITRDDQTGVMVTIYNGNLGLVKDTREVRLDAADHRHELRAGAMDELVGCQRVIARDPLERFEPARILFEIGIGQGPPPRHRALRPERERSSGSVL